MKYCSVCQKLVNKNTHDWCFVNKYKCKLEDMVGERRARALAEWDDEDEDRPPDQAETFVYDIETTRSPEDGVLSDFLTVMVTPDEQVSFYRLCGDCKRTRQISGSRILDRRREHLLYKTVGIYFGKRKYGQKENHTTRTQ